MRRQRVLAVAGSVAAGVSGLGVRCSPFRAAGTRHASSAHELAHARNGDVGPTWSSRRIGGRRGDLPDPHRVSRCSRTATVGGVRGARPRHDVAARAAREVALVFELPCCLSAHATCRVPRRRARRVSAGTAAATALHDKLSWTRCLTAVHHAASIAPTPTGCGSCGGGAALFRRESSTADGVSRARNRPDGRDAPPMRGGSTSRVAPRGAAASSFSTRSAQPHRTVSSHRGAAGPAAARRGLPRVALH